MSIDIFRSADKRDAGVIADLVNMAYRPESGESGWTYESDLVSGSRTNADQVVDIISSPFRNSFGHQGIKDCSLYSY